MDLSCFLTFLAEVHALLAHDLIAAISQIERPQRMAPPEMESKMDFDTSFHMTIGGKPVSSDSLFDVLNPATEKVLAKPRTRARDHLDSA